MHVQEGLLQAYVDRELSDGERQDVENHLKTCAKCRQHLDQVAARSDALSHRFQSLGPDALPPAVPISRARLQERIDNEMETIPMSPTIFSRKYRPIWASLAVLVVFLAVFAVPPVRALAGKFLRLFRAQQVETVYVNTEKMDEQFKKLRSSPDLQKLISSSLQVEPKGTAEQVASADQAALAAGIEVRVPRAAGRVSKWTVQPAAHVKMQVDVARVRAILDEIGRQDIELPAGLDGANVEVEIPRAVVGLFGECGSAPGTPDSSDTERQAYRYPGCVVFSQILSPTVTAPDGLNIAEVATAMLQVLGLTKEEATEFSQTTDWTTTLVVPVPRNVSSAETLMVDGVKGTLVLQKTGAGSRFMLIWIKNEIVYALSGWGDKEKALALAGSLS